MSNTFSDYDSYETKAMSFLTEAQAVASTPALASVYSGIGQGYATLALMMAIRDQEAHTVSLLSGGDDDDDGEDIRP